LFLAFVASFFHFVKLVIEAMHGFWVGHYTPI
jgi:hypothetical protein